ncbi:MAG: Gfo/Idh/MocA family oxidoreductase [Synechococcus sp.]|nr:Gfo/Idh/MocA family oxidoreductase [Synechococcus sp.]
MNPDPNGADQRPVAPESPLRDGLAGVGHFGQRHANVLAHLPGVELAALADPDAACLARVTDRYGVAARHGDALSLIKDEPLDAVILATPDGQHAAQARAALARGRHLFVEKPLASSWQEARDLQQLAVRSGVLLQTGLLLRYEPVHRRLQQQIAARELGALVSIRAQRNCSRRSFAAIADRIHTVHRTLIHDIDLLLWLSGSRVTSVVALEYRQGQHLAPQGCFALLRLADGSVAQLESSLTVPDHLQGRHGGINAELAVVGSERTARIEGATLELWPLCDGRVGGALREQLADFCACVRNGQPSQVADLDTAVEALRIAEAVIEAGRKGGVVPLSPRVDLPAGRPRC